MSAMRLYTVVLVVCSAMHLCQYGMAQPGLPDFTHFTVLDGLTDNYVLAITQDDKGYMWIGTTGGLVRFDGSEFALPEILTAQHRSIASAEIRSLSPCVGGVIAVTTQNGAYRLNTNTYSLQRLLVPDSTSFSVHVNNVFDAAAFADGSVVVASGTGFYHFSPGDAIKYRYEVYGPEDVDRARLYFGRNIFLTGPESIVLNAEYDQGFVYTQTSDSLAQIQPGEQAWGRYYRADGRTWLSKSQAGPDDYVFIAYPPDVWYYDVSTGSTYSTGPDSAFSEELSWESRGLVYNDSTLLVNTRASGIFEIAIDVATGELARLPGRFLKGHKVKVMYLDRDGGLWVGTPDGLFYLRRERPAIQTFQLPVSELLTRGYQDGLVRNDKLYLARYSRKVGLVVVDLPTMTIEKQVSFYSTDDQHNETYMIQEYHQDTLWLTTNKGMIWYAVETGRYGVVADLLKPWKSNAIMYYLAPPDQNGHAWMCGWLSGEAIRYHIPTRVATSVNLSSEPPIPFKRVKQIVTDSKGNTWFSGHSLARWNATAMQFDTLMSIYGGPNKFNDDILVIRADEHGSLWLHNPHNGLLEYRINDKKFVNYSVSDGLPSNVLRSFSPVWKDMLWIASHQHLARWNTQDHTVRVLGIDDGYPTQYPFTRNIVLDTARGHGYLIYPNEVARFTLDLDDKPDIPSPIMIERIVVQGGREVFFPQSNVNFKPDENNISVCFAQIDFASSTNVEYTYRLNGREWLGIHSGRCINLMEMQPGNYHLDVRARQLGGEFVQTDIDFSIAPNFWQTPWFQFLAVLLLVAVVVMVYRYRVRQIRERANLDKLLSETELQVLHAQMNPHFIFNSLNSIREMILLKENKDASRYLTKFAYLIRLTLEHSSKPFITLRQNIDYLERYIEMEQIRNSEFTCEIVVDPSLDTDEVLVPPMLIQPLVENAIWHGAVGKGEQLEIVVRFQQKNDRLVCEVCDNGVGIKHSVARKNGALLVHRSVGIENVRQRLELVNKKHQVKSNLDFQDLSDSDIAGQTGTKAILHLPLLLHET